MVATARLASYPQSLQCTERQRRPVLDPRPWERRNLT